MDVYDYYRFIEDNEVVLLYKGPVNEEVLLSILNLAESRLDELKEKIGENIQLRKKDEAQTGYRMALSSQIPDLYDEFDLPEQLVNNEKEKNKKGYITEVSKVQVDYFSDEKKSIIMNRFKKSNARLVSEWDISKKKLNAYGYL